MAEPGLLLDNRYRLDDRIAAGGMGEVWRGTDLALHRPVAVKLMQPGYAAQDAEGLARFRAEAQYAGSLTHPNIAAIYDFWDGGQPGQPYLVMELVNGPSLAKVLTRGAIGLMPTLDVIVQTAAGLQAAHEAGLVHRDIKPANLLVGPGGQIKISDFGIARADSSATLTGTGMVVGTAGYLAPERVAGQPATPASDLYALGIVAYECLTGQRPFEGDALAVAIAHLQEELPPLPPSVPDEVAGLVAALTAKDPRARPPAAGAVAERAAYLQAVLAGQVAGEAVTRADALGPAGSYAGGGTGRLPGELSGGVAGSDAGEPGRRRGWIRVAAGLAGVAAAGLAAWLIFAPSSPPHRSPPRHVQAGRQSARPVAPTATATPGLISDGQQPGGSSAPSSQPATPAPSPTTAPAPASSPPATPQASGSPPPPTSAPPTSTPPSPTPTAPTPT